MRNISASLVECRKIVNLIRADMTGYVKVRMAFAAILIVGVAVLTSLAPLILKGIVDRFVQTPPGTTVIPVAVLIAMYVGTQFLARSAGEVRGLVYARAERRMFGSFSERVFAHLARLPFGYHLQTPTGAVAQILENGLQGYQMILHHIVFTMLPVVAELTTIVVVLKRLDQPTFLALFCGALCCYAAAFAYAAGKLSEPAVRASATHVESSATLLDGLLCIETVKYFDAEAVVQARVADALARTERAWIEFYRRFARNGFTIALLFAGFLGSTVVISVREVQLGHMGVGDFVLINAYMIQMLRPVEMIGYAVQGVVQGTAMLKRILEILQQPLESHPIVKSSTAQLGYISLERTAHRSELQTAPRRENGGGPALVFAEVGFSFEPLRPVLQDLSFNVAPGACLAIVGRSGCGKSTLARLIARLLEPDCGWIALDGIPIAHVPLPTLRAWVAVVPQETVLLNDTIQYNITFGSGRYTQHDVEDAARHAGLHEFITRLPKGYMTTVGERGLNLSGGEKQRIAIARAMLRKPRIFVLDECTASLDTQTEYQVMHNLRDAFRSSTTLVIAHRLSTVVHADQIIVLDAGRLVEQGSHASLLARQGLYSALWRAQQEDHRAA